MAARKKAAAKAPAPSSGGAEARPPVRRQVSSGGVVFRRRADEVDVVLICVGAKRRWQLPKGIVDEGESAEAAAIRETREEGGVDAELVAPLETVQYWYQATERGERVRFHKFVHFFLLEYRGGSPSDHDHEVLDARWFPLADALARIAFPNERAVLLKAAELLAG